MAIVLTSYVIDKGDRTIKVAHSFYGLSEREAETYFREHQQSCEYFRAAVKDGRTIEETEEIDDDEIPTEADFAGDDDEDEED